MRPKERQSIILEQIRRENRVDVEDLAETFTVSAETIRRDLDALASTGAIHRVRGGAKRLKLATENSLTERMGEHADAKGAIARKLAGVLDEGDTLFMDTGSTTLACATALADLPGMTVITNALGIAEQLGAQGRRHRVFLLGGRYGCANHQTAGPMVIEQIARFQADHAVLTVAAVDTAGGAMDADEAEAEVARAMRAAAKNTIVLANGAKMGRRAAFRVCRLGEIDVLVSDMAPPPEIAAALQAAGAQVA
ncbi:MAG: DeoR/GlpR family DNA-binding transcription regulator [Pseudomonadota bacterium]